MDTLSSTCTCKQLNEDILMHPRNSLLKVKDQNSFRIFDVKFVENIGNKVSTWEIYGVSPLLRALLEISKHVAYFDDFVT